MLALSLLAALAPQAEAKDLRTRFGLGFHQQFGDVTTLSVRYGLPAGKPTTNVQVELDAGAGIGADERTTFVGARLLFGVVAEDNMNLYAAAGAGYQSSAREVTTSVNEDGDLIAETISSSGVRIQPGLGAQFFLFGLENLGFSAEWGLTVDLADPLGIETVGAAPSVAVHYYF